MIVLPDGVTWPEILQTCKLITTLLESAHNAHVNPRALTIALWSSVQLDMIAGSRKIGPEKYEALAKFGRETALQIIRDGHL